MRPRSTRLSHLDARGRLRMVDTSAKPPTLRHAHARGEVRLSRAALAQVRAGTLLKGDVVAAARLAGIGGAKQTPHLVPLCHVLPLDHVGVDVRLDTRRSRILIDAEVVCRASTGAEMEALVAVLMAAATVYDMCKAVDRGIRIGGVELVEKSGGRSGPWRRRGSGGKVRRRRAPRR